MTRSNPGPPTTVSARATRLGGLAVVVLAGIALVFSLMAWWAGGQPIWRGLTTSVGIGLLGLALVVGPQRRRPYYVLIGVSLALCALSLGLGMVGWW